jgi:hypothetical protein
MILVIDTHKGLPQKESVRWKPNAYVPYILMKIETQSY